MRGNVYRFTAEHYHAALMVTKEGIFVTDPVNTKAAEFLKAELKKRFDVPVRYLAYSHNHVMGGQALAGEGIIVVAHEYAAEICAGLSCPRHYRG